MKKLPDYFDNNSFDAIWASASILHIKPKDVPQTLEGITKVAKNGTVVYVGLKGGHGTILVEENKLGKPMQREFTLWTKEGFVRQTNRFGWKLSNFTTREGSVFRGKPTEWLNFFFVITK